MRMNEKVKKENYVFVVGGPGSSGSSTISIMLAEHFGLERVYGGGLMREEVTKHGYSSLEEFLSKADKEEVMKVDRAIDTHLRERARSGSVVVESKVFAALATMENIECTAKIWLDASLWRRTLRCVGKKKDLNFFSKIYFFVKTLIDLYMRRRLDGARYKELYGVEYSKVSLYNDIVIDSTNINEVETFDLILKRLKDGGYIKE
jgi:cytidylate kinase